MCMQGVKVKADRAKAKNIHPIQPISLNLSLLSGSWVHRSASEKDWKDYIDLYCGNPDRKRKRRRCGFRFRSVCVGPNRQYDYCLPNKQ